MNLKPAYTVSQFCDLRLAGDGKGILDVPDGHVVIKIGVETRDD